MLTVQLVMLLTLQLSLPESVFSMDDCIPWSSSGDTAGIPSMVRHPASSDGYDTDILVFAGTVGSGQDLDVDQNTGYLYAIVDTDNAAQDSAVVLRSTDNGLSWQFWLASYDPSGEINDPRIRVVKDVSGDSWVCMFFLSGGILRMRCVSTDLSEGIWTTVSSQQVTHYDVDGVTGNNTWVYAVYTEASTGNDIKFARCTVDDPSWTGETTLFTDPEMEPSPAIAAGSPGKVSVVFFDNSLGRINQLRMRTSSDYGENWEPVVQVGNNSEGYLLAWLSMAYSRTSPETGWIFYTAANAPCGDDILSYFSIDGGSYWFQGNEFGGSGYQFRPDVRTDKTTGNAALTYCKDPLDITCLCWTSPDQPAGFSEPVAVNLHSSTHLWHSSAGWNGTGDPSVIYVSPTTGWKAFFHNEQYTSISDGTAPAPGAGLSLYSSPNPSSGEVNVSFDAGSGSTVRITIHDLTGRLIRTLIDGEQYDGGLNTIAWDRCDAAGETVLSGVYLIRLYSGGTWLTGKVLLTR